MLCVRESLSPYPFPFALSPSGSSLIRRPHFSTYTRRTRPLALVQPASARRMQVLRCLLGLCSGSAGDSFVTLINPRRFCTQQDIIADVGAYIVTSVAAAGVCSESYCMSA